MPNYDSGSPSEEQLGGATVSKNHRKPWNWVSVEVSLQFLVFLLERPPFLSIDRNSYCLETLAGTWPRAFRPECANMGSSKQARDPAQCSWWPRSGESSRSQNILLSFYFGVTYIHRALVCISTIKQKNFPRYVLEPKGGWELLPFQQHMAGLQSLSRETKAFLSSLGIESDLGGMRRVEEDDKSKPLVGNGVSFDSNSTLAVWSFLITGVSAQGSLCELLMVYVRGRSSDSK